MTAQFQRDYLRLDDLELARLCSNREPGAVRHLISSNNQRLFRTAWSILKDRSEAEEALQSAYLAAFANMDVFEGRSSLSTWLTRIVANEALTRLRAERRRKSHLENEGIPVLETYRERLMRGSDGPMPDALAARAQLRALLEHAIAALPDSFRTVFVLREIEELSVEETAQALGIPAATVKTRLLRARQKLQQSLAPEVHAALSGTFPFAGADCEALTLKVLAALGLG
jgi:RNA polymerase sigma-70 factor (ECF subfamily)